MLEKLLLEIRSGGTLEIGALAQKMGTTPAMIKALLEVLEKAGYIQPFHNCGSACNGCTIKSDCQSGLEDGAIRLWQG